MNNVSLSPTITHEDVQRLCRDITDAKAAAILATEATVEELEVAIAWAEGESDVMGEARHPLSGAAAQIYEVLTADEDLWQNGGRTE